MRRGLGAATLLLACVGSAWGDAGGTAATTATSPSPSPTTLTSTPTPTAAAVGEEVGCEEEEARRKGVQKRDFLKKHRLEVSGWGGFFADGMTGMSYGYGGALAFYITEDLGVEASLVVTHFDLGIERPLTDLFGGRTFAPALAFAVVGNVLWSPVHFKIRATEHAIVHGDLLFTLGAGDTITDSVQGVTFDAGFGLKLYPTRWLAIRFDLRDYLMVQEALGVQRTVNNIVGLAGVSAFLPPWPVK